jgi:hypothetical protein
LIHNPIASLAKSPTPFYIQTDSLNNKNNYKTVPILLERKSSKSKLKINLVAMDLECWKLLESNMELVP